MCHLYVCKVLYDIVVECDGPVAIFGSEGGGVGLKMG